MAREIDLEELRRFIKWMEPGASDTRINALISSYLESIK